MTTPDVPATRLSLGRLARLGGLGVVVGILAGLSSAAFLATLALVTDVRVANPWLLVLLPLGGLAMGLVYHYRGGDSVAGMNLILEEIHEPRRWLPARMAPLVYVGSVVTQVFGGSAGREGTALQLSGSLTDAFSRFARLADVDRRVLLVASLAGGFGAAFGVPFAAVVFALEVQRVGRSWPVMLVPSVVAAFVGHAVVVATGVPHLAIPALTDVDVTWPLVAKVAAAGVVFGLVASAFSVLTHAVKRSHEHLRIWPPLRPFFGGLVVVGLTLALGTRDYNGLSLPLITASLAGGASVALLAFAAKLVLTSATVGSGFQGGEVTPMFVIGATLGVTLGTMIGVDPALLASVGLVAVLAGGANVPLACTVMAAEFFGTDALALFALACVVSWAVASETGVYRSQRSPLRKPRPAWWRSGWVNWRRRLLPRR